MSTESDTIFLRSSRAKCWWNGSVVDAFLQGRAHKPQPRLSALAFGNVSFSTPELTLRLEMGNPTFAGRTRSDCEVLISRFE
jgi:hypothetical protein